MDESFDRRVSTISVTVTVIAVPATHCCYTKDKQACKHIHPEIHFPMKGCVLIAANHSNCPTRTTARATAASTHTRRGLRFRCFLALIERYHRVRRYIRITAVGRVKVALHCFRFRDSVKQSLAGTR